jgi:hypothetical protein
MGDQKPEAVKQASLGDSDIGTERRLHRRTFLGATGILLAGGAAAMVAGARTNAKQGGQGDQLRPTDQPPPPPPDQARPADPPPDPDRVSDAEKKRRKREREREEREERERESQNPDRPRPADPAPPPQ